MPDAAPSSNSGSSLKSWIGRILILVTVLLLFAPTIIAKTPLRDWLINSALANEKIVASTQGASFGYFSPLEIQQLDLSGTGGAFDVKIEQIASDRSWLVMLLEKQDLGEFRFDRPSVKVVTGIKQESEDAPQVNIEEPASKPKEPQAMPRLAAEVVDGDVMIRHVTSEDPVFKLDDINFSIQVDNAESGSTLSVAPTTLLDNETLTPELCSQGLQLVAPMMADVVDVEGKISFRLERCVVPIGEMEEETRTQQLQIAGSVELADVTVGLNNKIMQRIVPLLDGLGRSNVPTTMTVNRSSAVEFNINNGRIEHRGLVMQMPLAGSALEIQSSGSVGMDKTLDLQLAISLPDDLLGNSALARFFTKEAALVRVTGNIDEPQIKLDTEGGWAERLQNVLSDADGLLKDRSTTDPAEADSSDANAEDKRDPVEDLSESVLGLVGGLLEGAGRRRTESRDAEPTEADAQPEPEDNIPLLRDRIRLRRDSSQGRRRLFPRLQAPQESPPEPTKSELDESTEI